MTRAARVPAGSVITRLVGVALLAALVLACTPAAQASTPHIMLRTPVGKAATHRVVVRASYTDILNDVMCTSCHEPLALAQSPQAISERAYIRGLIAQGLTKPQIERALVVQYGEAVLGKPPASGFNLTVYILPPALVLAGIVFLAFTLPKWRRRARQAAGTPLAAGPKLGAADAQRLNEDLARFD